MSSVQFSGFRTPYDEEQAYQRHITYLKTKQNTSKELQQTSLNNQLGVSPVMPMPKTTGEILGDEQEVNKMVQSYITNFFVDNPNLSKKFSETDSQYENRKFPSRYVFNQLSQDDKRIIIEQYPAIKTELSSVGVLTPDYFLNFIKNYKVALQKSGGVSKFSFNNDLDEIKGLIKDLPKPADINKLQNLVLEIQRESPKDEDLRQLFYMLNGKIQELSGSIPTLDDLDVIQQALELKIEKNGAQPEIEMILDQLETLPTRDELNRLGTDLLQIIHQNPNAEELKAQLNEVLRNIGSNSSKLNEVLIRVGTNNEKLNEIKGLIEDLPKPTDIFELQSLILEIQRESPKNDESLKQSFSMLNRKIQELKSSIPTLENLRDVERSLELKIEENSSLPEIDQILDQLEQIPTRDEINKIGKDLLRVINQNPSVEELKRKLDEVLFDIEGNKGELGGIQQLLSDIGRDVRSTQRNQEDVANIANIRIKEGVVKEIYDRLIENRLIEMNDEIEARNGEITLLNEEIDGRNRERRKRNKQLKDERETEREFILIQNQQIFPKKDRIKVPPSIKDDQLEPMEARIPLEKILRSTSNLPKAVVQLVQQDAQAIALHEASKDGMEDVLSRFQQAEIPAMYNEEQYQVQAVGKEVGQTENTEGGKGLANRVKNKIQPKYITKSNMIGKGVSIQETPKYIEFGKFCLSLPHLNNDILKVKYCSTMADVPNFKNSISKDFVDFIENFIDTKKINERQFEKLPKEEQKIFKNLINKSGLNAKYKVNEVKDENEKKEEDRFNLVKGQYIAGNDNPKVKDELRRFIIKFMMEGKINKKEGQEILFQLSM